ncbi:DHA2 family efflux MFS transporter permease subunit [Luteipulveratus flavus]|uniref:DHA2 family efflux MFS transporter permease subunit n=1 Tax=Luteipulveratus flavus TaxID=3031728 RepID=A0ABT6C7P3_9MICO|nr:DHA2 family efflux MFS transporter permease subunit [Luteipulveratus sp. YIM 133296]MDF8263306.1 DHA2 family efflux MFS transporter permease subunit [Luteipulveratus sp. YIM 133296]
MPSEPRLDRATLVLVATMAVAAFIAVLDGTAVAVALRDLQHSLDAGVSSIVWVTTGYLMAAGLALPLVGWATDRFGGRRVFLTGLGVFVTGSVLSGLAWSVESLVAFRVLQGFGGGLLEPVSLAVVAGAAPRAVVGRVMGLMSLIINIAPVLGPLVGGVLAGNGLWRWIFLANLPLGVVVASLAVRSLPRTPPARAGLRADARGMLLLSPGFVLVLVAVNRWGDGAGAALPLVIAVVGAVLLATYARHALRTDAPVLDLRLLAAPAFARALLIMGLVGFMMYAMLTGLPVLAERRYGLEGLSQGVLVTGLGSGLMVSMSVAARISDRVGPRPLVRGGGATMALLVAAVAGVHDAWALPALVVLLILTGLAFGAIASPTFSSVYRTLTPKDAAQGTTALFITVQLAASLGVTVLGLLLNRLADPFGVLFAVLAGAALVAGVLARGLPGRPGAPS